MPPKKLSFERKKFAPYIEKVGGEDALEKLFLEFLSNHFRSVYKALHADHETGAADNKTG